MEIIFSAFSLSTLSLWQEQATIIEMLMQIDKEIIY